MSHMSQCGMVAPDCVQVVEVRAWQGSWAYEAHHEYADGRAWVEYIAERNAVEVQR